MVRQLRDGKGQYGLILANGGVLSYQHAVCLSRRPRSGDSPYPETNPLAAGEKIERKRIEVPVVEIECEGKAVVEVRFPALTRLFIVDSLTIFSDVHGRVQQGQHAVARARRGPVDEQRASLPGQSRRRGHTSAVGEWVTGADWARWRRAPRRGSERAESLLVRRGGESVKFSGRLRYGYVRRTRALS